MSDSEDEIDPFELRLQFNELLLRVSASQDSLARAASFATRWARHHDVLYDALMEFLQSRSASDRMNLFYLCDHICMMSLKIGIADYTASVMRDLKKIVVLVCPPDSMGNVNIPNVRKVLASWRRKNVLSQGNLEFFEHMLARKEGDSSNHTKETFSKHDIVKRMEEDRERHKRIREEAWIRPSEEAFFDQFEEAWELTSDFNDGDLADIAQELKTWQHHNQLNNNNP